MAQEIIWKKIDGLDDYEFSNTGLIKSHPKRANHYKTVITPGSVSTNGYWTFMVRRPGFRKQEKVHRLIARAHLPNPLGLPIVNHKDCNPLNNNISNLEWCTDLHNKKHAQENGLMPKGEQQPLSKLTNSQVAEIYTSNKSQIELAIAYGVTQATISCIKKSKTWVHVTKGLKEVKFEKRSLSLILEIYNSNFTIKEIAQKHKLSRTIVENIKTGFRYSKITGKIYNPKKVKS